MIFDDERVRNKGGGFSPGEGHVYLPKESTYLAIRHEIFHAEQYVALGKEKYMQQTKLEREEYVYKRIMERK